MLTEQRSPQALIKEYVIEGRRLAGRCPECGHKTQVQNRYVGGQGDVRVRSCLNPCCMWGEFVHPPEPERRQVEDEEGLPPLGVARLVDLIGEV